MLFAFDPTRPAALLLGGDNAGNWQRWYRDNLLTYVINVIEEPGEREAVLRDAW